MMRLFPWFAACCSIGLLLAAGTAGAVPPAGGLSSARGAVDMIDRAHGNHHSCQWDADGMHYHLLGVRRPCYIQHRHRNKDEPKTEPKT